MPTLFFKKIFKKTLIAVKSYNRPDCLSRMLKSWYAKYPELQIVIVDDSDENSPDKWKPYQSWLSKYSKNAKIYDTNITGEINIALARNLLVEYALEHNFEYIGMVDDDFVLDKDGFYEKMFEILLEENADIVACSRSGGGSLESIKSRGTLILDDSDAERRVFRVIPGITTSRVKRSAVSQEYDCLESDLLMQLFIAKTQRLKKALWDPELGMNEHYDWLLNVKSNGLKAIACNHPALELTHISRECTSGNKHYHENRNKRWVEGLSKFMDKHKIVDYYDEWFRHFSIDNGKLKRQVINNRTQISETLPELGQLLKPEVKKSEFYKQYLVNFTDTVGYNPCLKMLKSKTKQRFIVNNNCDFVMNFWKLDWIQKDDLKTSCLIKDELKELMWKKVEKYLASETSFKNVTVTECFREFSENLEVLYYAGKFHNVENEVSSFRISSYLSPSY